MSAGITIQGTMHSRKTELDASMELGAQVKEANSVENFAQSARLLNTSDIRKKSHSVPRMNSTSYTSRFKQLDPEQMKQRAFGIIPTLTKEMKM